MIFQNATNDEWPTVEELCVSDSTMTLTENDTRLPTTRLVERAVDDMRRSGVQVDRVNRMVRNVAITGTVSRNGYQYAAETLRRAVPLYVGRPVFLDHGSDPESPQSRSTRDLVGTVESARIEEGSGDVPVLVRGDIRVLDTESGRTFLALCESDEPGVGMSHVVLARRSEDGSVVQSIEKVISVDAVMYPATTSRLSESETTADGGSSKFQSTSPKGACGETNCLRCAESQNRVAILEAECERLRGDLKKFERANVLAERDVMLASSGLPKGAISDLFRRLVREAETKDAAQQLIQDRLAMLAERRGPLSDPRDDEAVEPVATIRFVDAVKGRR